MKARSPVRLPHDLISALASREAVVVLGAGASMACGLPGWLDLLKSLIQECEKHLPEFRDTAELDQLLSSGFYPEVADVCCKALPGGIYRDFLQRIFQAPSSKSSALHRSILKLPLSGIVTTNYDTLLEREYIRWNGAASTPPVYTHKNLAHLAHLNASGKFYILKAHGHVDDVDSIVLTRRDYHQLVHNNQPFKSAIRTILATRTLIFVGHSLRDPDMSLLLAERATIFDGFARRHFAIMPNPGRLVAESLSDNYNIHVIPYNPKNRHIELVRLFDHIQKISAKEEQRQVAEKLAKSSKRSPIRKVQDVMEHERRICQFLKSYIELERARFLQGHADSANFSTEDKELIEKSITDGESRLKEKTALERQLYQAQKMEAIGTLAGGIAHDFNNLLVAIVGWSELAIAENQNPDPTTRALTQINHFALRARELVSQILTFARMDKDDLNRVDFKDIVSETARLLESTLPSSIKIIYDAPAEPIEILANATQIRQVILNLGINARDAIGAKDGVIKFSLDKIDISTHPDPKLIALKAGVYARLAVDDSGCGMNELTLSRIFEPFFTTKKEGTGLGLSVVHGMVTSHGGGVVAKSIEGKGTTFEVVLPLVEATTDHTGISQIGTRNVAGAVVVIVDDERYVLEIGKRILERHGFSVHAFADAEEALSRLPDLNADLVICDLSLPKMSGFDLARTAHAIDPGLPVVICSGLRVDPASAKLAEIREILRKPFKIDEILGAAVRNLRVRPSAQA